MIDPDPVGHKAKIADMLVKYHDVMRTYEQQGNAAGAAELTETMSQSVYDLIFGTILDLGQEVASG